MFHRNVSTNVDYFYAKMKVCGVMSQRTVIFKINLIIWILIELNLIHVPRMFLNGTHRCVIWGEGVVGRSPSLM
jgi:hypothetical protein